MSIPSEATIKREMEETGLDRLPAIRRIQQRNALRRNSRQIVSRSPGGDPLYFVPIGGES